MSSAPPILPTDISANFGRNDPSIYFPESERNRIAEGARRYAILMEDVEIEAEKHIARYIPANRRSKWGPPDTSSLPLAVVSRAMSTPGHYAQEPALDGPGADTVSALVTAGGLWQLAQHAEYLAYGMGSCLRLIDLPSSLGRLTYDAIPHHYVWAVAHPDDRRVPIAIFRLRRRTFKRKASAEPERGYAWDVHSVEDPAAPFFGIFIAEADGVIGEDVTDQFLPVESLPMIGDAYPWRDDAGPFLPYEIHRREDTGDMFNWQLGKSACLGTLNAILLATVTNHVAINSSGSNKLIAGGKPKGAQVTTGADGQRRIAIQMEFGEIGFLDFDEGVSALSVVDVGNSGNLATLDEYHRNYTSKIATDLGVPPSDPSMKGANPMSASALQITNAEKRNEQRRMAPLCRAVDAATLRKSIALARRAGLLDGDPGAVTVRYHEIEKAPEELRSENEATDWDLSHGQRSAIDVYMERNPGVSREAAIDALARIARDAQAVADAAGTSGGKPQPLVGVVDAVERRQQAIYAGTISAEASIPFFMSMCGLSQQEAEAMANASKNPNPNPAPQAQP